jgi:hypothetical protein
MIPPRVRLSEYAWSSIDDNNQCAFPAELQDLSILYKAFNEVQHQISDHIVKLLMRRTGYTDAQMIKILTQGDRVTPILRAIELSLAGCGKTRLEADAVPQNSLVSTAQPDKKKECVEKTSNSWMCSAT